MKEFLWLITRLVCKLTGNNQYKTLYYRWLGMKMGGGTHVVSKISCAEPQLVEIGNDVIIGADTHFITHDHSISRIDRNLNNLFGYIKIGDNCFIGQRSTIMYGVTLADNIIVASGSVVVNSFDEQKIIIGGNPAKKIGTWEKYIEKNRQFGMSRKKLQYNMINHPELFVTKQKK